MQPLLAYAARHLEEDLSLAVLARRAGLSPYHLQRVFADAVGETPKQLTLRLRLERAAVLLNSRRDTVLDIAVACGFESHEVFTRAFRRRFGTTPQQFRRRVPPRPAQDTQVHAQLISQIGPCIGLFHKTDPSETPPMTYSIQKKNLDPQPVLVVRRRVKRSEIAATIGGVLPHVFLYAQKNGITINGFPLTRYLETGPGMVTMEPGMRVTAGATHPPAEDPEVRVDTLPGGAVAFTTHYGPYDKLTEGYAAVETWIEEQGLTRAGAPWEAYCTDPGDFPDPKDWKTEIYWPVK
ncbi:MAG: AraC family transcriptional regulator [Acidobacteriota bacterium]